MLCCVSVVALRCKPAAACRIMSFGCRSKRTVAGMIGAATSPSRTNAPATDNRDEGVGEGER